MTLVSGAAKKPFDNATHWKCGPVWRGRGRLQDGAGGQRQFSLFRWSSPLRRRPSSGPCDPFFIGEVRDMRLRAYLNLATLKPWCCAWTRSPRSRVGPHPTELVFGLGYVLKASTHGATSATAPDTFAALRETDRGGSSPSQQAASPVRTSSSVPQRHRPGDHLGGLRDIQSVLDNYAASQVDPQTGQGLARRSGRATTCTRSPEDLGPPRRQVERWFGDHQSAAIRKRGSFRRGKELGHSCTLSSPTSTTLGDEDVRLGRHGLPSRPLDKGGNYGLSTRIHGTLH